MKTLAVAVLVVALLAVACAPDRSPSSPPRDKSPSLWSPAEEADLRRRYPMLEDGEPSGAYVNAKCRIIEARRNGGTRPDQSQCGSYDGGLAAIRAWLR